MKDRLPPLTGLRAFDAAARHMSFAKAAEELHVTPAALSYQIKSLEQHLGAPVFVRLNRAVELTDVGRSLAAGTQESFAGLHRAWRRARASLDDNLLIVTAGPAFTAKWLAPRMFGFAQAHPEIDLRFSATLKLMDFDRDDVDIAIRFGVPREEEALFSEPLLREWVTPMMHPNLADRYATPESLLEAPLIHQDDTDWMDPPISWAGWFHAIGLTPPSGLGAHFSQADHALDAAAAGAGVVMGRYSLAEGEIRNGRLVAPFDLALTTDAQYRLIGRHEGRARPQAKAFVDWILAEAKPFGACRHGRRMMPSGSVLPEGETVSLLRPS
ncbi:MAG: transcriptional regulator GcvA [Pseudomonadota bacterium]